MFYRTFKRTMGYAKLASRAGRRAKLELEWGLIAATIAILIGIRSLNRKGKDPRRLSPAALLGALRACMRNGDPGSCASRVAARLARALKAALKDNYTRFTSKRSRSTRITKNTPKPLKLKPPRIRSATQAERAAAARDHPQLAT